MLRNTQVDATGSMGDEIDMVRSFLVELSRSLGTLQGTGNPVTLDLADGFVLDTGLDIAVSLVWHYVDTQFKI